MQIMFTVRLETRKLISIDYSVMFFQGRKKYKSAKCLIVTSINHSIRQYTYS